MGIAVRVLLGKERRSMALDELAECVKERYYKDVLTVRFEERRMDVERKLGGLGVAAGASLDNRAREMGEVTDNESTEVEPLPEFEMEPSSLPEEMGEKDDKEEAEEDELSKDDDSSDGEDIPVKEDTNPTEHQPATTSADLRKTRSSLSIKMDFRTLKRDSLLYEWRKACVCTEKVYFRRLLADMIFPIEVDGDGDQEKARYFDIDVLQDNNLEYPWFAVLVSSSANVAQSLAPLPPTVKLVNPKHLLPESMPENWRADLSASEAIARVSELDALLQARRQALNERRAIFVDSIRAERLKSHMERMRIVDTAPTPPSHLPDTFHTILGASSVTTLLKSLARPPDFMDVRVHFLKKINRILDRAYKNIPGRIQAHLFGSSVTGLGSVTSDVDITIELHDCAQPDAHPITNMYGLAEYLRKNGMTKVVPVARARVPICKFFDPEFGLAADINVGNMLGIVNSKLIWTYLRMDPCLHPLIMLIKHWARMRDLNDPAGGGTVSSYAYTLMAINYLQVRGMIPSLQALFTSPERHYLVTRAQERALRPGMSKKETTLQQKAEAKFDHDGGMAAETPTALPASQPPEPTTDSADQPPVPATSATVAAPAPNTAASTSAPRPRDRRERPRPAPAPTRMVTWDVSFISDLDSPLLQPYILARALGDDGLEARVVDLFYGFMRYYGWVYEYRHDRVCSVRVGRVLDYLPEELVRAKTLEMSLVVEDPFQLDRNTTGMVEEVPPLLNEFRRAARILYDAATAAAAAAGGGGPHAVASAAAADIALNRVFEKAPPREKASEAGWKNGRRMSSAGLRKAADGVAESGQGEKAADRGKSREKGNGNGGHNGTPVSGDAQPGGGKEASAGKSQGERSKVKGAAGAAQDGTAGVKTPTLAKKKDKSLPAPTPNGRGSPAPTTKNVASGAKTQAPSIPEKGRSPSPAATKDVGSGLAQPPAANGENSKQKPPSPVPDAKGQSAVGSSDRVKAAKNVSPSSGKKVRAAGSSDVTEVAASPASSANGSPRPSQAGDKFGNVGKLRRSATTGGFVGDGSPDATANPRPLSGGGVNGRSAGAASSEVDSKLKVVASVATVDGEGTRCLAVSNGHGETMKVVIRQTKSIPDMKVPVVVGHDGAEKVGVGRKPSKVKRKKSLDTLKRSVDGSLQGLGAEHPADRMMGFTPAAVVVRGEARGGNL
ncbi:hypothetical protein HK101_009703 [Irineochytrium annulatum]|nr:hypothetical protein HK101_009703 [Irineochytrium annulatum]